jgi:hypothetical protein
MTWAIPRDVAITSNDVIDLTANGVDLITDGGFTGSGMAGTTALVALYRGES